MKCHKYNNNRYKYNLNVANSKTSLKLLEKKSTENCFIIMADICT